MGFVPEFLLEFLPVICFRDSFRASTCIEKAKWRIFVRDPYCNSIWDPCISLFRHFLNKFLKGFHQGFSLFMIPFRDSSSGLFKEFLPGFFWDFMKDFSRDSFWNFFRDAFRDSSLSSCIDSSRIFFRIPSVFFFKNFFRVSFKDSFRDRSGDPFMVSSPDSSTSLPEFYRRFFLGLSPGFLYWFLPGFFLGISPNTSKDHVRDSSWDSF